MFLKNKWMLCKSCVSAMFTRQGQEDGKSYLAYKDGGEAQTRAVMPDTFRSIAKGRVRGTRTVKMSQNVLSWALQQYSGHTHVNHHHLKRLKICLNFPLHCVRKRFSHQKQVFPSRRLLTTKHWLDLSPKGVSHFRAEIKAGCRGWLVFRSLPAAGWLFRNSLTSSTDLGPN